ncbi:COX15/CtaA family protein [Sphingobacterium sp. SRCM116780]|uniref:COX15/CtaA family protein n=1 Tax=Sphingobacterium sp. SRCM116780 TaxID=2907623 RepID=UPI001F20565E|nr:COX15/CtaA family protein [Sphingobacterium sp. SRCM116780]UIR55245.1 COX15/CtaA family protein [Sphingobacterium sp. SRCM116780]
MLPAAEKRFVRTNFITIIVLFLVIVAGGVVRSTGSGMGCPDWPKCFNRIIPPTAVSQLPVGYEEHYIAGRAKKNERFAKMIDFFGYRELASKIRHDKSILVHEEFNVAKTWTEYANRLVGVVAGFCLLFTAIYSFTYIKSKRSIFVWSVINLFVVVFQAWLGSIVVSTNLTPWVITVHMLLALVIVAIAIYTYFKARTLRDKSILVNRDSKGLKILAIISLLLMLVQVIFGTEVREMVDALTTSGMPRADFIQNIGQHFEIHRWLAYSSLILVIVLFFLVRSKFRGCTTQARFATILLILIGGQMLSGIILARFAIPAFAQTTHLVIGSLLFGTQYYLMLLLGKSKR